MNPTSLWGTAAPGPFAVGLRPVAVDRASVPRIRLLHFFPARRTEDASHWTVRELVHLSCRDGSRQEPIDDLLQCEAQFLGQLADSDPKGEAGEEFLELRLASLHDATPDEQPRPLVLFDGGLTSNAITYLAIAEFLASHGFHAATVPSLPPDHEGPLTFDRAGIHRKTLNLERSLEAATTWEWVDAERLGLAAWSVGGVSTAVLAARTPTVRGLLSLDAGLGYDYGAPLYRELAEEPLSTTFFHMTGTAPNAFPVPKVVEFDVVAGDAVLAEVHGINHSQFTLEGGAAAFAGHSGETAEAFWRAHSAILAASLLFFEHTLNGAHTDFVRAANRISPSLSALALKSVSAIE